MSTTANPNSINQPGSVDYRPDPNPTMDLQTLMDYRAYLAERLLVWQKLKSSANAILGMSYQIGIDFLKNRIALYDAAIAAMPGAVVSQPTQGTGAGSTDTVSLPSASSGSSTSASASNTGASASTSPAASTQGSVVSSVKEVVNNPQGFFVKNKKAVLIGAGLLAAVVIIVVIKRRK